MTTSSAQRRLCTRRVDPPPFRFSVEQRLRASARHGSPARARARGPVPAVARLAWRTLCLACGTVGRAVDLAFGIAGLTVLVAVHLALWSYSMDLGPAAGCAGLPCPGSLRGSALLALGVLAPLTFGLALLLRRGRARATGTALLVLVTFDLAAMLVLGTSLVLG